MPGGSDVTHRIPCSREVIAASRTPADFAVFRGFLFLRRSTIIVISINRDTGARRAIYVMNSGIFNNSLGRAPQCAARQTNLS
jgi:hypothetical protein